MVLVDNQEQVVTDGIADEPDPAVFEGGLKPKKTVAALALLVAMLAYGAVRLSLQPTVTTKVKLRIMQPNLQQDVKFNYAAKAEVMQKYLALSDRASGPQSTGVRDAQILIWPESAFPFFLTREADAMAQIAELLPKGTVLMTGSVRAPDGPPGARVTRAYNSIYLIDHDGGVLSVYDKLHLVPFGEFLPFQDWMEKLGFVQLTRVQGGFIPGTRRKAMDVPNAPRALPLICYEAVFPGNITERGDRPGWIINLTNDGWFGNSTGPYQHLQQMRMRAIEEGLPVVRAANTGISAVIDPSGRIVARLGLGIEGVLDANLPTALPPTAPPPRHRRRPRHRRQHRRRPNIRRLSRRRPLLHLRHHNCDHLCGAVVERGEHVLRRRHDGDGPRAGRRRPRRPSCPCPWPPRRA